MHPKDYLRVYTQVFLDKKLGFINQNFSNKIPLLPKSYYYKSANFSEVYIDTLSRSDLLDLIQKLAFFEKNQRVTPKQLIENISFLKDKVVQQRAEIDRLINESIQFQGEIKRLNDQLDINFRERQSEKQHMQSEIFMLSGAIAELQASTSWRITAPLRSLSRVMEKSKRLLNRFVLQFMRIARVAYHRLPLSPIKKYRLKILLKKYAPFLNKSSINKSDVNNLPNLGGRLKILNQDSTKNTSTYLKEDEKHGFRQLAKVQLLAFLASGQVFIMPRSVSPTVSVILILYNQAALTFACLRSIRECAEIPLEVVIVDNASSDETKRLLEILQDVKIIKNINNLGFLRACNQAVQVAVGENLLFLNNDGQLLPGSLSSALATLKNSKDIGAVGGKIILLDGSLQEAGSIVWRDGSCQGYGRGDLPFAPQYMFERDVDYCSGAFLLTKRFLFNELGGFDETFVPAYYEETDFCFRLKQRGLRIVYDPKAIIFHYEFGSASSPMEGIVQQRINKDIFVNIHQEALNQQYEFDKNNILKSRIAGRIKSRILYIEDCVPHRGLGRGYPRSNKILSLLVDLGFFVTLYPLVLSHEEWDSVYSDIPRSIEVMIDYGADNFELFLDERKSYYDIFFVSRPHNMQMVQDIRERRPNLFDNIKIIYDAEAVFATREICRREIIGQYISEKEKQKLIYEELDLTAGVDEVIAVSDREKIYYSEHGRKRVHVLGHAISAHPTPNKFSERRNLLFVGAISDDLSPNADSLIWFVQEVLPLIEKHLNDEIILRVAGLNNSDKVLSLKSRNVKLVGFVDNLFSLYNESRVFIAPTRFASGIPFKAHEAAAYGLPIVATTLIKDQLGWRSDEDLLDAEANDSEAFADRCVQLYTNPELWLKLRNNALKRINTDCSCEAFRQKLEDIFSITVNQF